MGSLGAAFCGNSRVISLPYNLGFYFDIAGS
jgi:hypothetical protein